MFLILCSTVAGELGVESSGFAFDGDFKGALTWLTRRIMLYLCLRIGSSQRRRNLICGSSIYGSAIATLNVEGEIGVGINDIEGGLGDFCLLWSWLRCGLLLLRNFLLSFSFFSNFLSLSGRHGHTVQ
eukprot:TRINITY_DN34_c0_g1_i1.p1 TRINITY_DN34_c0_g1~~TRINITY_DN34_c0_g1_i1.p1  ORF type:complete len:128 (+),score=6.28 TRINITY_DN34_c0_g1_i1:389-772(+)